MIRWILLSVVVASGLNFSTLPAKAQDTRGMSICQTGQSPIIIVNGIRVQQCRLKTKEDEEKERNFLVDALAPNNSRVKSAMACANDQIANRVTQSKASCKKAMDDGDHGAAYYLANLYMKEGKKDISLSYMMKASDLGSKKAHLIMSEYYSATKNFESAAKYYGRCYKDDPDDVSLICANKIMDLITSNKVSYRDFFFMEPSVEPSMVGEISPDTFNKIRHHRTSMDHFVNWQLNTIGDEVIKLNQMTWKGQVTYFAWILPNGKASMCRITSANSLGITKNYANDPVFSKHICLFIAANYIFKPATDNTGKAVPYIFKSTQAFNLPRTR